MSLDASAGTRPQLFRDRQSQVAIPLAISHVSNLYRAVHNYWYYTQSRQQASSIAHGGLAVAPDSVSWHRSACAFSLAFHQFSNVLQIRPQFEAFEAQARCVVLFCLQLRAASRILTHTALSRGSNNPSFLPIMCQIDKCSWQYENSDSLETKTGHRAITDRKLFPLALSKGVSQDVKLQ